MAVRDPQFDRNSADHWRTCPHCAERCSPVAVGCPACGQPLVNGYPANSRERSFCRFCGAMTVYLDGCCRAHRDLLALDVGQEPELESRAMGLGDLSRSHDSPPLSPTALGAGAGAQARPGGGDTFPPSGEAAPATREREGC